MEHHEWLEWRRNGIGSSDAAVIMGVSPWKCIKSLYEEKVFGICDYSDNPSMKRGRALEPIARNYFSEMMQVSLYPRNVISSDYRWLRASLDGIDQTGKILVEIKCPNKDDHILAKQGKIPHKYYPQIQHQLLVTGLSSMYYFSYDGQEGVHVEVGRDEEYLNNLFKEEEKFWISVLEHQCMEDNIDWSITAKEYKEKAILLRSLEKEVKILKEKMIHISSGKNASGCGVKMFRSECIGSIDYKAAIEDYLDNLRSHYPEIDFRDVPFESYRKDSFTKWNIGDI